MENRELKISIDANGNIHREVVERSQADERKQRPSLLKRLLPV